MPLIFRSRGAAALAALLCLAAALPPCSAAGDGFPSRPVRVVVPFAPGGPADFLARSLAPSLERELGQAVLVENRVGADGVIGAKAVLEAPPDGHTLLCAGGALVPLPLLRKQPPFDLRGDFVPVSKIAPSPWALYVSRETPAASMEEFLAHARAHPGALNYASSTLTDALAAAQFMKATGARMTKVPYKGAGQAMPDLIAGRVQVSFSPVSAAAVQQVRAGQLRMLAVVSAQRSPLLPEVPTMAEAGVPGMSVPGWLALFAPAGTPRPAVERLNRAVQAALAAPDTVQRLARQAVQVEGSTPEALAALVEDDLRTWQAFVRDSGLVPE